MVKRLETSTHDPLGITDSACKNQLVVVSVQYGSFNTYIPIRSTTIGKSRVTRDPIAMHTSWRSNSDIASVTSIGYPRVKASGESSTTKHRLLHASGPHPIPPPNDPKNSDGTSELDWSKISSWNSKGTPKLVQQFTSRSAGNAKLVHRLGAGAARRSSAVDEEHSSSTDQLGMEQSWSLRAAKEQERTEQAQLQTKRGADAEVALE
ncbi:carboxyl-terminal-processing peptidase 1, chloroplastic [Dorcoceras hygrometricum]|uniref:Carboxyl-terminal-processing peptidase 1, chloroplastic n=1 Tax=Dorcoceras hygrometricum TaxID=472368 RepID=A0A2Z7BKL6_9LAMI|nr:carboxyl-terminal-processing peptidase 1, chloroplastic [Dorcoceras hygrometricum]